MVYTYNLFMGDSIWRIHTGERAPFWCTYSIFTHAGGKCFTPTVIVYQSTHYIKYLHYNTPSDLVVHNSLSGYIYFNGWIKSMSHFSSICFPSTLNIQGIFYDGHVRNIDDRKLNIIWSHHIQDFILEAGDCVHYQPNNNGPNLKLNNLYGNKIINWIRNNGSPKFTSARMNSFLVETW